MSYKTPCQTHNAEYGISIGKGLIEIDIHLPFELPISDEERLILHANLHNVLELVLKPYFYNAAASTGIML